MLLDIAWHALFGALCKQSGINLDRLEPRFEVSGPRLLVQRATRRIQNVRADGPTMLKIEEPLSRPTFLRTNLTRDQCA